MTHRQPKTTGAKLTEERLTWLGTLQEMTIGALGLSDPERSVDDFLERLGVRLAATAAVCFERPAEGPGRLHGAWGLSQASRALAFEALGPSGGAAPTPWPELAEPGLMVWEIPASRSAATGLFLVVAFQEAPARPQEPRAMLERLAGVLEAALRHRRRLAKALEAERALAQQKALIDLHSRTSFEAVLVVSAEGEASFNRRFADLFGLAGESATPVSPGAALKTMANHMLTTEANLAAFEEILGCHDEQGRRELRTQDGQVLDVFTVPVRGAEGTALGRSWFFRDVTELRRVDAELKSERDFVSAILDTTGALIVVLDKEGRIVRFNHSCERLTLYAFEEVRGRPFWDFLLVPEEVEPVKRIFASLAAGNFPSRFENFWVARDGTRSLIAWSNTAIVDETGEVAHIIGTGLDVTERARIEQERTQRLAREKELRAQAEEAERHAAFLASASRELAGSLDCEATLAKVARLALPDLADWCIVDVVDDGETLKRVAVAHVDAEKADLAEELRTRYPLDPKWPEGITRVLRSGKPEFRAELGEPFLKLIGRDARHLALLKGLGSDSAICVPMVARGRLLGGVTLLYSQETSGRRYRPEDVPFAEELGRQAGVAIDNARLYREAQDLARAREEFLSIASHELRTPVTSLQLAAQGMLRLARSGPLDRVPKDVVENVLDTAVRQSMRLGDLIEKLLDVSRLQVGLLELQLEEVDLAEIIRDIVKQGAAEIAQSGCKVEILGDAPAVGRWDRSRLEQVVSNLLSNALKYGAGKPVAIALALADGLARLTVTDRGIGIAPEHQARIFERFGRAVSARNYAGLGLGLYIVHEVLVALGGTIRVESAVGKGSRFTVELPCAGPPPRPVDPGHASPGAAP